MSAAESLAEAFAGESQANRKYLAFAAQADKDGFPNVAKLFRAAAAAETVHAHAHLRAMDGIKTTAENLEAAVAGGAEAGGEERGKTCRAGEPFPPRAGPGEGLSCGEGPSRRGGPSRREGPRRRETGAPRRCSGVDPFA